MLAGVSTGVICEHRDRRTQCAGHNMLELPKNLQIEFYAGACCYVAGRYLGHT